MVLLSPVMDIEEGLQRDVKFGRVDLSIPTFFHNSMNFPELLPYCNISLLPKCFQSLQPMVFVSSDVWFFCEAFRVSSPDVTKQMKMMRHTSMPDTTRNTPKPIASRFSLSEPATPFTNSSLSKSAGKFTWANDLYCTEFWNDWIVTISIIVKTLTKRGVLILLINWISL